MKIFVTGNAGFIGSHLVDALLARGDEVVGVDNFSSNYNPRWKEQNIVAHVQNPKFHFYRADITDESEMQRIMENTQPEMIVHLAAAVGVRTSMKNPLLHEHVNVGGTTTLLSCAQKNNIKKFIFASSSSVYANQEKIPFAEDDSLPLPLSPYAASKHAGELMASAFVTMYNMNCIGLRFFTVYGERGRPDMSPFIFTDALMRNKPLPCFGDGTMERDFTYVGDIVRGIIHVIDKNIPSTIINLGNHHPVSILHVIQTLERITGRHANIEFHKQPPADAQRTYADIQRAKQLLHWTPITSLDEGLVRLVEWYKQQTFL